MKVRAAWTLCVLAFCVGCGAAAPDTDDGTDGNGAGSALAGAGGGGGAGAAASDVPPEGQGGTWNGASPDGGPSLGAGGAAGELTPSVGIPCGDGWGTTPIPGSVELGLASTPEIPGVPGGLTDERAIFDQINDQRTAHGLPPLAWSEQVANVARSHAADMNQLGYFDHGSSERPYRDEDGNTIRANWLPRPRLDFVYPGHFTRAGENIARHRNAVETVVEAWMDSPGHRAAILDDYGWTATHGAIGMDGAMVVFCPVVCAGP
jgi:hypothetical protein